MKFIFLVVYCLCIADVMAQNDDTRKVELGAELTSELQATDKGNYNFANLLRLEVSLPISSSISIDAASISAYMTADESIGGDIQTFSNIDAGTIPFTLSICNVAWQVNDRHTLYAGIRNMNVDYFTSPATSLFTNSSCGIYPTISANYPIANYPVASVGIHYRYRSTSSLTERDGVGIQASLYNGTGYNRFTGRDNIFRFCPEDDGIFGLTEVTYTRGGSFYSLGNALYCKEGISATPWLYTEQSISRSLTLLAGYSHAFSADAVCKDFIGCGITYQLGRCQLGAFTDYAHFAEGDEYATELTCRIPIFQHMDIQPTTHLIAFDGRLHCAATLRMTLSF